MKKLSLLLCGLLLLFCCSCGFLGDQNYFCDIDEVKSIQIIRLDKYVEGEYRFDYTVLSQISDCATFVDKLNHLKHSVNWGDPRTLYEQYVVIQIEYHNGDYDMIHYRAQWFHRSGATDDGYFFFDTEQFNALISDYLPNENS